MVACMEWREESWHCVIACIFLFFFFSVASRCGGVLESFISAYSGIILSRSMNLHELFQKKIVYAVQCEH